MTAFSLTFAPRLQRPLALLLLLLSGSLWADLRVEADRLRVEEGETLTLRVQLDGRGDGPDFDVLEEDFTILGNQKSSEFRSINGRSSSTTQWRLTLLPKHTGRIVIPELMANGVRSAPLAIDVRPVSGSTRQLISQTVFFENEVDRDAVYLQAQLLYTIRLFYAQGVQLYMDLPAAPQLENAIVQPLGEVRAFKKTIGSRTYDVIEQRYAVFPQRSGPLELPAVSVTGGIRLPRGTPGPSRQRTITIRSDAIAVTVLPKPAAFPADADWLPASRVELVEQFQQQRLEAGVPAERTVMLLVDGQPANLLPAIDAEAQAGSGASDGVRAYPERPMTADDYIASGVRGSRVEVMTLIPGDDAREVILPQLRLPWWDVENDRLRWAELQRRVLPVDGGAGRVAPEAQSAPEVQAPVADPQPVPAVAEEPPRRRGTSLAWLGFALWLLTLLLWGGREYLRRLAASRSPAHGGAPQRPADPAASAWRALRAACGADDAAAAAHALTEWLSAEKLPTSDGRLDRLCERLDVPAPAAVRGLRAGLYGRAGSGGGRSAWRGDALLRWATALRKALQAERSQAARDDVLPPLYGASPAASDFSTTS